MNVALLALLLAATLAPAAAASDGLAGLLREDFTLISAASGRITAPPVDAVPETAKPRETSEVRWAMVLGIRFYQQILSSQDEPSCTFTPSCSRFGVVALKEAGLFQGFLMTLDRLQRCHGFNRPYYAVDPESGRLRDPVEHNHLW